MTGKTGTGKSSLINAIVGQKNTAKEGKDLGGVTRAVTLFTAEINDVTFNIWDSPGLQDTTEDDGAITGRIKSTLKENCQHLHLLLYCIRMDRDRFEKNEEEAIKHFTDIFKPKIWETSVFALTFANHVLPPSERDTDEDAPKWFKERIGKFQKKIVNALVSAGMDREKALKVPVIPTGYHTSNKYMPNPRELLDRNDWFNPFWYTCANSMQENALMSLLASQRHRLNLGSKKSSSELEENKVQARAREIEKKESDMLQEIKEDRIKMEESRRKHEEEKKEFEAQKVEETRRMERQRKQENERIENEMKAAGEKERRESFVKQQEEHRKKIEQEQKLKEDERIKQLEKEKKEKERKKQEEERKRREEIQAKEFQLRQLQEERQRIEEEKKRLRNVSQQGSTVC